MASAPGDSELTRILKAYHISKARDRSDLPDWLFTEQERRPTRDDGTGQGRRQRAWETSSEAPVPAVSRSRGFRDIYDSVDTDNSGRDRSAQHASTFSGTEASGTTKATDRLKAIRDAKRQAATMGRVAEPAYDRPAETYNRTEIYDRHRRAASTDPSSGRRGPRALETPSRLPSQRPGGGLPKSPRGR